MSSRWIVLALTAWLITGCQSMGGVRHVPVSRDHGHAPKHTVREASALVDQAHRAGAQHYAPYAYHSAQHYLDTARELRRRGDRAGAQGYAKLARDFAGAAVRDGSGVPPRGTYVPPSDYESCLAEFARLEARWRTLNPEKAKQVSPVIYAQLTANLSRAEHELANPRRWSRAIPHLAFADTDIDTIESQDVDGDGIPDMLDGAPWAAEDHDGFEDDDGIPDPDNDGDGIPDIIDRAPNDSETFNRWHDDDGMPDEYPPLETLYFASGSAALSADSRGYLRGIIELLNEWPGLILHIRGHTDGSHTEQFNEDLASRRTETVQRYLIEHGAADDQIVTSSYGKSQPVADERLPGGTARNRRVELEFE